MEDDVAPGSSGGVSVSEKLPTKPFLENIGGDNKVEESYEEEIMVEVVGSDVFVDGVSCQKEGFLGSGEVRGRNVSEATDVLDEGDVNKIGETEVDVGFSESVGAEGGAVCELSSKDVRVSEATVVTSEILNRPAVEGSNITAEKGGISLPSNNASNVDHSREDSVTSNKAASESDGARFVLSEVSVGPNSEGPVSIQAGGTDRAVDEVGLVTATDGVFEADAENGKIVDEEVLAAENKDSILKTDALVSVVQDGNQGSLKESHGIKCEPKHGFDDASRASPESSSHERSSVGERMEVKGAEFNGEQLDIKDGASNFTLPHLSCSVSNDECLKNGGDVETDMVHQNHAVSNEPTQRAGGGDTAEVSEDNGLNIEILADTEENQSNMLTSSCPVDTEIVQADSVISDQNVAVFQVKVVDGEGSCEKGDPIVPEISIKCPGSAEIAALDASAENMYLSTEDSCSKVETDDAKVAEHHVTCNDPLVSVELGLDIAVEEYGSSQNKEQEVAGQITESANIPVQITEASNDRVASIDLLANEVTSIVCDVDTSRDEADAENGKIFGEKVLAAENKDSILKTDALVSDVQDENQGSLKEYNDIKCEPKHGFNDASHASPESSSHERSSVGERMEVKGVEFNGEQLDFKDGAPNITLPHLSCGVSNDECLKSGGDVETDMVHQNHAVSNEPTQCAGGGDTAAVSEDNGLNIEIIADTEENQANMLTSSCPVDTEIVQADSVISDQKVAVFQVKVVDGDVSCEKGNRIDPEISIKCPGSAEIAALDESAENMYLPTEDSCSKVEMDDAKVAEHHVTCNDPLVSAELGLDIVVEEYGSSQNKEQEVAVQITESANIPVQITEASNDGVASIDLLPNEVTSIVCDVDTSRDEADAENGKIVDEKVLAAENKDSILKTDALVSDVQDENQGSLKEYNDIKCEPKHGFDDASHATPESSSHERSSVGERMEVKGVEFNGEQLDFKDGAPNIALPHLSCGGSNDECLKNGGDVETDMVHQNHVVSNEPALQAGGGDTAEVSEDNGLNIEILADTEENQSNMLTSSYPKNSSESKERSLTELMGVTEYSPDAEDESFAEESVSLSPVKKRKALDHPLPDGYDKRVSIYAAKVSTPMSQTPKPSFKIGECIRRVASQLTGSTSLGKVNNEDIVIDGSPKIYEHSERRSVIFSAESSSVNEMLSKLQLLAQDPKKVHSFLHVIHTFFMGFRSTIALNRRGRKKNADQTPGGSAEDFEFDDVNDSYWTDRIVQNYSEEQRLNNSANGVGNLQIVPFGLEKSVKPGRKPNSRKRYSTGSYPTAATELDENVKRRKHESSPAELILNFAERNSVPSEINLNKMFRRFGPLMESETEVDHESGCAKVIFKRGSDAEVARNSSEKFNIFGPVLVNYQIGYAPLISVKVLPVAIPPPQEDAALML